MIRWLAVAAGIIGLSAIVVVQLDGAAEIVAWEALLLVAVFVLARRRWPSSPPSPGSLFSPAPREPARRPRSLAAIEMEMSSAVDPALGGARQLRHRLESLARHRADLGDGGDLRTVVDEETWRILHDADDVVPMDEMEAVVARLERL